MSLTALHGDADAAGPLIALEKLVQLIQERVRLQLHHRRCAQRSLHRCHRAAAAAAAAAVVTVGLR